MLLNRHLYLYDIKPQLNQNTKSIQIKFNIELCLEHHRFGYLFFNFFFLFFGNSLRISCILYALMESISMIHMYVLIDKLKWSISSQNFIPHLYTSTDWYYPLLFTLRKFRKIQKRKTFGYRYKIKQENAFYEKFMLFSSSNSVTVMRQGGKYFYESIEKKTKKILRESFYLFDEEYDLLLFYFYV